MRARTTPIRRTAPSIGTTDHWNKQIIAVRAQIAGLDAEIRAAQPGSHTEHAARARRTVLAARLAQLRAQRDYSTGRGVAC